MRIFLRIALLVAVLIGIGQSDAMQPYYHGLGGGVVQPAWAIDQTLEMPYTCTSQVWINPSTSPYGASGAGSLSVAQGGTGTGTQAHPYLTLSAMYAVNGNTVLGPGTCINVENSTPLIDDPFDALQLSASSQHGNANTPTGYIVMRSTDGSGNPVPASGPGVTPDTVNASAAHIVLSESAGSPSIMAFTAPADYWIIDGLNLEGVGDMVTQNFNDCVTIGQGGLNYYNNPFAPTHFMVRNSYVHGCGGSGIAALNADWVSVQNNVVTNTSGAPGFQKSGIDLVVAMTGCAVYFQDCPPVQTGYDSVIGTILNHRFIPYHDIVSGNWVDGVSEFAQPGTRSDGNCIIIDTNTVSQNAAPTNYNAGPYAYRTLIANNVTLHCGGRGIHNFISQHIDVVNNTTYATNVEPNTGGSFHENDDCFFVNDCHFANNVSYAIGGTTKVRVAYTGGSLGPVAVDNVIPFLFSWTGGNPTLSTPMPVTMQDTTTNAITAVTIDAPNLSTTPGGISGTLTFNVNVSVFNGSLNAPIVPQPFNISSNASSFANFYAATDAAPSPGYTITTCLPWAQVTLPCSGGNAQSVPITNSDDTWYYNDWFGINGVTGALTSTPGAVVPPTLSTPPGNNLQSSDPLFVSTAFNATPNYIMQSLPNLTSGGSGYVAGCTVVLAGGTPATPAAIKIDTIGGGGAISTYHLWANGSYASSAVTAFTQASTSCAGSGATFSGAVFTRPWWIDSARPNLTLQAGSPAKNAGSPDWCLKTDITGATRPCPSSMGAYE